MTFVNVDLLIRFQISKEAIVLPGAQLSVGSTCSPDRMAISPNSTCTICCAFGVDLSRTCCLLDRPAGQQFSTITLATHDGNFDV